MEDKRKPTLDIPNADFPKKGGEEPLVRGPFLSQRNSQLPRAPNHSS